MGEYCLKPISEDSTQILSHGTAHLVYTRLFWPHQCGIKIQCSPIYQHNCGTLFAIVIATKGPLTTELDPQKGTGL